MNFCLKCFRVFQTPKALKSHYQRQQECNDHYLEYGLLTQHIQKPSNDLKTTIVNYKVDHNEITNFDVANSDNESVADSTNYYFNDESINSVIKKRYESHLKSGNNEIIESQMLIQSQIDLLIILKQAKTPLYLFDQIWNWTQQSATKYNINFASVDNVSRNNCLKTLKKCFDMNDLEPIKKTIKLKGSNQLVDVIIHKFEHCLYSLLNDDVLMDASNLLISLDTQNNNNEKKINKSSVLNDIDTGSVFQKAKEAVKKIHIDAELCPILFFIDKTHTDVQGRLCLEQIRFTLGIFNRETRNNPNAWRTLGYIADQSYIKTKNTYEKNQDYHHMISVILEDFKILQKELIEWDIKCRDASIKTKYLKMLVLLIMGDTDGHDKLAGRYTSRNGIQKPCRCCNIPFAQTDDPETNFVYNKHSLVNLTSENTTAEILQSLSIHGIDNAWKDVVFCDNDRGLYGALCPDILHCIKHGLFNYALLALFDRKAAKKSTEEEDNDDVKFTKKNVFTEQYSKYFNELAKKYGYLLSHQSDRELPRTNINTNYTTITRKNAHEMSGLVIAILIVFTTDEGTNKLDETMSRLEAAKFIQLFELLLMLENFCSTPEHKIFDVKQFKEFMPYLLNTYKEILDRQTGCGCKFIKFHLPNHFADDIFRFGSMINFDTEIGESHHKTEAKYPSNNTQRRKSEFEFQTATRQIENFAVSKAAMYYTSKDKCKLDLKHGDEENLKNKWYRYEFDPDIGLQQKTGKNKFQKCEWIDSLFQKQLLDICKMIYKNGCVDGKLKFFSQHNRYDFIFRADPNYQEKQCWYDWANVNWSDEVIPTKLLIFLDIEEGTLKKPFKIGDITIIHPGQYALCYSLRSATKLQPAHTQSYLVQYGSLDVDAKGVPILYIFHIDCIASTISAVPYKVSESCFNAKEWIFLRPKSDWYKIFTNYIKEELDNDKKIQANAIKKRKTN